VAKLKKARDARLRESLQAARAEPG